MARATLELLDSPSDLTLMREAARRKALEFAWPNIAERLRKLFEYLY